MKTKLGVVIFLMLAVMSAAAQTNSLTALLQQGLFEEQANRNLDAAIADYQALAQQFDRDRQLAATAVFRLGECYRAQGKTNEAAGQYERIIRDFSDQQTLVTLSRQDLAGLGVQPDETAAQARRQLKDLLVKQIALAQQDADDTRKRVQTGLVPETEARAAEAQVLRLQQQLVALDSGAGGQTVLNTPVRSDEDQEIARIQDLIQNSPDLINAPKDGCTPLVKAAYNGWLKVAEYLLDHGATINTVCPGWPGGTPTLPNRSDGPTPLLAAVAAGNKSMTEFLIQHGAEVNLQGKSGYTPLDLAAQMGFEAVVQVLLANHAEVNTADMTPLYYAVNNGRITTAKQLLAAGAKVDLGDDHGRGLLICTVGQPPELLQMLLAVGANPNSVDDSGRTPLSYAADKTKSDLVKMLLDAKADPNLGDLDLPLLCAVHRGDLDSAKLLLAAGANPNYVGKVDWSPHSVGFGYDNTSVGMPVGRGYAGPIGRGYASPLWLAVDTKSLPMVQLLLKFKADPSRSQLNGQQLIFDALNQPDVVVALLDAGADANAISLNHEDWTPLTAAIYDKNVGTVEPLLKHGANPNHIYGRNPIIFGAIGNTNILEMMLDAGANIESRDPTANVNGIYPNWTPLLAATYQRSPAEVAILLKHGAKPDETDAQGNTALHWAVNMLWTELRGENLEIAQLLLDKGANPNLRDHEGFTPLDLAKRRLSGGNDADNPIAAQIVSALRQHGALDNLPHWEQIMVGRPEANFSTAIFRKGAIDWNHFTLMEAVLNFYDSSKTYWVDQNGMSTAQQASDTMPFPDFSRVVIVRPSHGSTNETRMVVNLLNSTNNFDFSKDVPLEFGDVVEIPERDHALGEKGMGLTTDQKNALETYAEGHVQLVAHGQKVELEISRLGYWATIQHALQEDAAQQLLLVSSDLSRVKVTRHDAQTGKTQEWVLDCSGNARSGAAGGAPGFNVINVIPNVTPSFAQRLSRLQRSVPGPGSPPLSYQWNNNGGSDADSSSITDLWLRDGDVIEVPEKP